MIPFFHFWISEPFLTSVNRLRLVLARVGTPWPVVARTALRRVLDIFSVVDMANVLTSARWFRYTSFRKSSQGRKRTAICWCWNASKLCCWLVVTGTWILFFPFSWECHHPNWLIFFRRVDQPPTRMDPGSRSTMAGRSQCGQRNRGDVTSPVSLFESVYSAKA